ncbi:MAG: hypothetical protein RMJ16_00640 [Thermoguttaceae bacterium]|nr:hypothetical protein [Thermoguttaceae bacterium]
MVDSMSREWQAAINVDEIVRQVVAVLREQGVPIAAEGPAPAPGTSDGGLQRSSAEKAGGVHSDSSGGGTAPQLQPGPAKLVAGGLATSAPPQPPSGSLAAARTGTPPAQEREIGAKTLENHRCILRKRVITLADIAALLPGTRELVVPPKAVISPAVCDALAERSIRVVFAEEPSHQRLWATGDPKEIEHLYIEVVSRRLDPAVIVEPLRREGIPAEATRGDCLVAASQRLAERLGGGKSAGVILTRHLPLAVCLANRHKVLRATWALSMAELLDHVADIGANVLVLDFRKLSSWQMVQLIARFVRLGRQEPPWQELLPGGP